MLNARAVASVLLVLVEPLAAAPSASDVGLASDLLFWLAVPIRTRLVTSSLLLGDAIGAASS